MWFFRYASGQTDKYTDPESDTLIVVLTPSRMSLKIKVKGQKSGHQGQKTAFSALSAACVRFMFGKTT